MIRISEKLELVKKLLTKVWALKQALGHNTSGLECRICSSLLHSLKAFCGHGNGYFPVELWKKDRFLLQIHLPAAFPDRVKFRRTDAI